MKRKGIIIIITMSILLTACGSMNKGISMSASEAITDSFSVDGVSQESENILSEEGVDIDYSDKLIYTCSIDLETLKYDETLETIKQAITTVNGFIQSQSSHVNNYYEDGNTRYCDLSIRVPSDQYDVFLKTISDTGSVTNMNSYVDNITQEYYDTETRIKALRTQEKRLLELLSSCETVEDMITVEARLSEVQSELAVYQTNLNIMNKDVSYSTVNISISEVREISVHKDTFTEKYSTIIKESWEFFLNVLSTIATGIIYLLPFSILAGIILLIISSINKKKKNKKKESKEKEEKQEK